MYKWLLCWRYLRTRYLALVCIISVMLGVATLIVVNSVMGGFSQKLRQRLHGLLSDVIVESTDYNGFPDPDGKMQLIRRDPFLYERIEAMTPALEIFAMIQFSYHDHPIARPVRLVGIEPEARARLGGFAEHLVIHKDKPQFQLTPEAMKRWKDRQEFQEFSDKLNHFNQETPGMGPDGLPLPEPPEPTPFVAECCIVGHALAWTKVTNPATNKSEDLCLLKPGDDVVITTISGVKFSPVYARFAVCDHFRSEMSEYDSQFVFVPLKHLQRLRTMEGRVTSIQIRLKGDPSWQEVREVKNRLLTVLSGTGLQVQTWEDKQGPLLAAIAVEKGLLNVLLFLIIAVAGFGILAIFSMIVVEKTRDIGIMKALGASNGGVMKIFLGYGLLLGVVGSLFGTAMGITITVYINQIEWFVSKISGQEIFPRTVYYFNEIPTDIRLTHVMLINFGAVGIAVMFSVLPALRAALLHPVRALRFE